LIAMPSTVSANARTIIHQGSGDQHLVLPDVCKTPPGPVPIPYPNLARSADAADGPRTVHVEGCMPVVKDTIYTRTSGDEAGKAGGVVSGTTAAEASFVLCSFDVKIEGRGACRAGDPMTHNSKNTAG
jgi:hypothetical protein